MRHSNVAHKSVVTKWVLWAVESSRTSGGANATRRVNGLDGARRRAGRLRVRPRGGRRSSDGFKTGAETDVDWGGGCARCANGRACLAAGDCASGLCAGGTCAAMLSCNDGKKGGNESDVDCGGACLPCANGKACLA